MAIDSSWGLLAAAGGWSASSSAEEILRGSVAGIGGGGVVAPLLQFARQATKTEASGQATAASGDEISAAQQVVKGISSVNPLLGGLVGLFVGGGESAEAPTLTRFSLPAPVRVDAGVSAGSGDAFGVDYAAGGVARPVTEAPQITVQVQAMDSRSFLDHSAEIAMAVRQAMLESAVLNDVIREV